jgi:hypothetical protein
MTPATSGGLGEPAEGFAGQQQACQASTDLALIAILMGVGGVVGLMASLMIAVFVDLTGGFALQMAMGMWLLAMIVCMISAAPISCVALERERRSAIRTTTILAVVTGSFSAAVAIWLIIFAIHYAAPYASPKFIQV